MNPNSIKYKSPGTSSITRFERIHTVIFDNKSLKGININKVINNLTAKSPKAREIQEISVP